MPELSREMKERLLSTQQGVCFICEKPLSLEIDLVHVDHVVPRAGRGKDDELNYAITHEQCNLQKLDSDLRVARAMSKYSGIKDRFSGESPNRPHLGDFLEAYNGGKFDLRASFKKELVETAVPELSNEHTSYPLFTDPLSGLRHSFVLLPIEYIHHYERINPRAISPRIQGLISEFLQGRPQLHVGLAWGKVDGSSVRINVFDGQHKIAAQLLLGVRKVLLRVFWEADENILLQANMNAGTTLRQVAFNQSVQRFLGSQLYVEKVEEFRKARKIPEDELSFSEQDLVDYFKGERREVTRYIIDGVREGITRNSENRLMDYVEFTGRGTDKPLSYETLEKTVFSIFINKTPSRQPLDFKVDLDENPRQLERSQIVRLLNMFAEHLLVGKYDFNLGSKNLEKRIRTGETIPEAHMRAHRVMREEVLYNILQYVKTLIKHGYAMENRVVQDTELFQHKLSDQQWIQLDRFLARLAELNIWVNKQLSGTVFGSKQDRDYWKTVFSTGKDRMGTDVLAKPLNLMELVAP